MTKISSQAIAWTISWLSRITRTAVAITVVNNALSNSAYRKCFEKDLGNGTKVCVSHQKFPKKNLKRKVSSYEDTQPLCSFDLLNNDMHTHKKSQIDGWINLIGRGRVHSVIGQLLTNPKASNKPR